MTLCLGQCEHASADAGAGIDVGAGLAHAFSFQRGVYSTHAPGTDEVRAAKFAASAFIQLLIAASNGEGAEEGLPKP